MSQITLGAYTVRIGLRIDNPAFPSYLVYRGQSFIGKQFSMPSASDCEWLERNSGTYATDSRALEHSRGRPIWNAEQKRRGRPSNAERARRLAEAELAEIPE